MLQNVRFGAHPINWCNDDMDFLGDEYSFEDIIDQAAKAGYTGIELGRKFPRDPKVLKPALAQRGLELTSGWCDTMFGCPELREQYIKEFKEKVLFFKEMGSKYVIAAEGTGSECWDPREYRAGKGVAKFDDAQWKLFADGLNEVGAYCKEQGMTLVYHVHTGTCVETFEETQRLCDMTDDQLVYLLADTGHLHVCGVDIPRFFDHFASRIKYVHLKDVRPLVLKIVRQFHMDFNSAVQVGLFTVPGDGCIDYPAVFDILDKKGYEGWMLVEAEQYLNTPKAFEFAVMARNYITRLTGI